MPRNILIDPQRTGSSNPNIQFSGSMANTIKLEVLTSGSVQFTGVSGSLLSITDSLSGSLFAVSDISGLPILEAFSDDRVVMGKYNSNALVVTGSVVGIGTASPTYKLQVGSFAGYGGDTTGFSSDYIITRQLDFGSTTYAGANIQAVSNNELKIASFNTHGATTSLTFHTQASYVPGERMRIDGSGNVGIGTSSFTGRLYVRGSSTGTTTTLLARHGIAVGSNLPVLDVQNSAGTSLLFVSGSGNVGIGTNVPSQKIDVAGSVRVTGDFYRQDNAGIAMTLGNGTETHYQSTYIFYNATGATEYSRLNSTGLGLGTASPAARVHVSGSSTSATPVAILQAGIAAPTGKVLDVRNQSGTTVASIDYLGNISANTGSFSGDVSITGNLTVLGTQTIISSSQVNIGDNIILLNSVANPQQYGGIYVADTTANTTGSLLWDSNTDRWTAGRAGSEINLVTTGSTDNLYNKTIPISGVDSNVISGGTQGGIGYFNTSGYLSASAAGTSGQILQSAGTSSPTWVNFGTLVSSNNVITGSGTAGYHAKFTSGNAVSDGVIYDNGTNVAVGTTSTNGNRFSVNGTTALTGSVLPGNTTSDLGSAAKPWRDIFATSHTTTASTTSTQYTKVYAPGEAGKLTATKSIAAAGTATVSLGVNNGAVLFDIMIVASESGFSVAKKYTVATQYDANPVVFKIVDTGPYTGADFTVAFSKSDGATTLCTITNGDASTHNFAITLDVAATSVAASPGTTVTIF